MDIRRLEECIDLARTLNFTKSAENLFITQSVLSKHIAAFERELGFPIFERTKRNVKLTELGTVLIDNAIPLLEAYDNMLTELDKAKGTLSETLRVGYLKGATGNLISYIQAGFSNFYPSVEVDYITYEFAEITEALRLDEIDLALAKLPNDSVSDEYGLRPLFDDRYFVACDVLHPLSELDEIVPENLQGLTIALPALEFYTDDSDAIADFLSPEKNNIEIKHTVRDVNSLPILAQSHDWIGITFGHLKKFYEAELMLIPIKAFDLTATFGLMWKKRREDPVLCKWVEIAEDVFRDRHS